MTTEPGSPSFRGASTAALLVALVAMLTVITLTVVLCRWLQADPKEALAVTAPAVFALGLSIATSVDAARRRRAVERSAALSLDASVTHPMRLGVPLLVSAILLLDTVVGVVLSLVIPKLVDPKWASVAGLLLYIVFGGALALAAFHASRYFGVHPCRWTVAAVGCAFLVRLLIALPLLRFLPIAISPGQMLLGQTMTYSAYLLVCVAAARASWRLRFVFSAAKVTGSQRQVVQPAMVGEAAPRHAR
jgi:hypothetical protein